MLLPGWAAVSLVALAAARECRYPISDPEAEPCSMWRQPLDLINALRAGPAHDIGCPQHSAISRAPRGLAFVGMSLSRGSDSSLRYAPTANRASVTHQTKYNLDLVQDRGSRYLCASNDDGWLSGGGTGSSPATFNLPNIDSTHIELAHLSTIASNVAASSHSKPDGSDSYPTGLDLKPLLKRLAAISFDPIAVVPTIGAWTPGNEFQVRFNPYNGSSYAAGSPNPNPTMTAIYEKAICALWDVSPLDKTDPFHVSIIRDTKWCSEANRQAFFDAAGKAISTMRAKGPQILNADIKRYSDVGAGGFYLFVTRNRPLIYFAPTPSDNRLGQGCTPYLARWQQDGAIVNFAVAFAVSAVTAKPPIEVQELVEHIRIPAGATMAHDH